MTSKILSPLRLANSTRPRAEFVNDVTIPHGYECTTASVLKKVWQIRNVGKYAWPKGSLLLWVDGPVGPVDEKHEMEIPLAEPGEAVKIEVKVVAPKTTGYHTGTYRLCDEKMRHFGPWMEVELSVYDPAEYGDELDEDESYVEEDEPVVTNQKHQKKPPSATTQSIVIKKKDTTTSQQPPTPKTPASEVLKKEEKKK